MNEMIKLVNSMNKNNVGSESMGKLLMKKFQLQKASCSHQKLNVRLSKSISQS